MQHIPEKYKTQKIIHDYFRIAMPHSSKN